jgi:hypothetical protein
MRRGDRGHGLLKTSAARLTRTCAADGKQLGAEAIRWELSVRFDQSARPPLHCYGPCSRWPQPSRETYRRGETRHQLLDSIQQDVVLQESTQASHWKPSKLGNRPTCSGGSPGLGSRSQLTRGPGRLPAGLLGQTSRSSSHVSRRDGRQLSDIEHSLA